MARYKKIMLTMGITDKELLEKARRIDYRCDKSLINKIIDGVCLPNKQTLDTFCEFMVCKPLDIYDAREIDLLNNIKLQQYKTHQPLPKAKTSNNYTLSVCGIPREIADRVFNKSALEKLGYASKSDYIRQCVLELDKKLQELENKTE